MNTGSIYGAGIFMEKGESISIHNCTFSYGNSLYGSALYGINI